MDVQGGQQDDHEENHGESMKSFTVEKQHLS